MPTLRAIVSVNFEDRVLCGQPGCGHSLYRRIHIVEDGGELQVLGSTCFARRFGDLVPVLSGTHGGSDGRNLNPAERQMLLGNTAELLAQFDAEREREMAAREARRQAAPPRPLPVWRVPSPPKLSTALPSPWSWRKPLSSMTYFGLDDGTGWIRAQHVRGDQFLMPWPSFDGWDECFPQQVGFPDLEIGGFLVKDLVATVAYLRKRSTREFMSGVWREPQEAVAKGVRAGVALNYGL